MPSPYSARDIRATLYTSRPSGSHLLARTDPKANIGNIHIPSANPLHRTKDITMHSTVLLLALAPLLSLTLAQTSQSASDLGDPKCLANNILQACLSQANAQVSACIPSDCEFPVGSLHGLLHG